MVAIPDLALEVGRMPSPRDKGKQWAEEDDDELHELHPAVVLTEEERKKRSFERSLAGPSVGKAGLIRDQTGTLRLKCAMH